MTALPFDTLLIANRGEIALRIVRTARRMGLRTVVVAHEADRGAPALAAADEIVWIEGRTGVAAYLDGAQIIEAARRTRAGAIHPGYGFLSENAGFARDVAAAGMVFIGPTPEAIDLMGDKIRARAFVAERGFPVAPSAIEDDDPATFLKRARALGAPLLVKPSAGGGGKGMRIVRDMGLLAQEIAQARSEGERYFGDGRLYVERFVEQPRHIEVQVMGDAHGTVVHLGERECSIQRRFQKIVEETPSPALTADERVRICETAAEIARAAGYRNAGTVEFIYGRGAFYFLEMNTRLQVEHPVTEMVTGIDLVEMQIRVAAGEPLGLAQADIRANGHSIELRIYAESAPRGFTPTTGPVLALRLPAGEGVRVDAGIAEGQRVTTAFDPMLAKLIVHAGDRTTAIGRARKALADFVLLGCETNIAFLDSLIADPAFAAGEVHTGWLDANPGLAAEPAPDPKVRLRLGAVAALATRAVRDEADAIPALHAAIGGWRN
ncbi:acetyl/propionyl/methylcrotonyl-CoA carboxylase subunit alpha [Phreatobacter sp. HK31-P]